MARTTPIMAEAAAALLEEARTAQRITGEIGLVGQVREGEEVREGKRSERSERSERGERSVWFER